MEFVSGNIFIREMRFSEVGEIVQGHTHNFDHTTYVVSGSVLIEALNEDGSVRQSVVKKASEGHNWVLIRKDVCHKLTALESGTICHCVYAHRNPQGEVVQVYEGWTPGYL